MHSKKKSIHAEYGPLSAADANVHPQRNAQREHKSCPQLEENLNKCGWWVKQLQENLGKQEKYKKTHV